MKVLLTQKQQRVFEFIQRYIGEHRKSPFIREIQAECQITSYKSALDRLNAIERKGFIKRLPNKHRAIMLIERATEPEEAHVKPQAAPVVQGAV